jgi:hypothetical protein
LWACAAAIDTGKVDPQQLGEFNEVRELPTNIAFDARGLMSIISVSRSAVSMFNFLPWMTTQWTEYLAGPHKAALL